MILLVIRVVGYRLPDKDRYHPRGIRNFADQAPVFQISVDYGAENLGIAILLPLRFDLLHVRLLRKLLVVC